MLLAAQVALGVYAVLLGVGGVMGYLKAGSRPSLIAGLTSGFLALVCLGLSFQGAPAAMPLGAGLAALMSVVFGIRLAKTHKFMPSGLLLATSLIVLVILGIALATS